MAASSVKGPQGDHCINLEWDIINACNDTLLTDCATAMSQFIKKFNGVVRSFKKIITDQKQSEEKFSKLSDHCQQLENCKKCVKLQNRLDDQVSKMQTLATIFGQISNENVGSKMKLVKAKDMFTQMVEDSYGTERENQPNDNQNLIYGKRPRECVKSPMNGDSKEEKESDVKHEVMLDGLVTPKKRIRTSERSPGKRAQSSSKRETGKKDLALSPIIGKGKHRSAVTRSQENKTPLTNLSNRLDITHTDDTFVTSSPESKSPSNNRKSTDGEPSPSLLRNPAEEEKKPSPNLLPPNQPDLDVKFTEEKSQVKPKRDSLSLLQKNVPKNISPDTSISQLAKKCKRSLNSKKLKQARLSFSNMKMKEPSDVSMQDSFCGGLRTFSSTAGMSKTDEEEMLKIAVQLSLNESLMNNLTEDDDVIDASPSNQQKPVQKKKIQKQRQRNATSANVDSVTIHDDEDTVMFTTREKRTSGSPTKRSRTIANDKPARKGDDFAFPLLVENENQSKSNQSLKQESAASPLKSLKKVSPTKDASHIYLEPVVRKKAEKMNLPGWSCKKCKDFYEAAFKGNEDMIREKMNECSRHRGKFNPEREDTPAGFWDLNMPPTQDTEAFNKRNNRD